MYVLGERGLRRCRRMQIFASQVYYLGASSSPDRVQVVRVEEDRLWIRSWPYNPGQEYSLERPSADDLISRGTRTRRDRLAAWVARGEAYPWAEPEVARLTALLEGRDLGPSDLSDDWRVRSIVRPKDGLSAVHFPERGGDPWYAAERFGSVAGCLGEAEPREIVAYRIEGTMRERDALIADGRFEITETVPLWGESPSLGETLAKRAIFRAKVA